MNIDWTKLLLGFAGRTGKRDFWLGFAALFGAGIVANLLPLIGPFASLALIWPWTALLAKRLHDIGKSGWLVLIPAAPAALSAVLTLMMALAMANPATMGAAFAAGAIAVLVSTFAMLVGLCFLLWVGLKPGEAGANAWGDPVPVQANMASKVA